MLHNVTQLQQNVTPVKNFGFGGKSAIFAISNVFTPSRPFPGEGNDFPPQASISWSLPPQHLAELLRYGHASCIYHFRRL